MPAEVFGPNYRFLATRHLLSFDEMESVVRAGVSLGVKKLRLTGGEPLLRKGIDDLVALLSAVDGVEEVAMTTNAVLLAHYAERLALAGLTRVTVSLDAIAPEVFSQMNGVGTKVERVLKGIDAALLHGLPVKINCVVQKGVNESQVVPLIDYALSRGIEARFIEFMDVGETNGWNDLEVLASAEVQALVAEHYDLQAEPRPAGAVAERFTLSQGGVVRGRVGFISSVSRPFCHDCGRIRVSADGKLYGCLFASEGQDVKELLRAGVSQEELLQVMTGFWQSRSDRYSELRGQVEQKKVEMSYIGG